MRWRGPRAFGAVLFTLGILAACDSIVARPLTSAPLNVCVDHPCDGYAEDAGAAAAAKCQKGRCEVPSAAARPDYPFWIVVNLPDTSFFAPGLTYVFYSNERGDPAFQPPPTPSAICNPNPPQRCLRVGGDALFTGTYRAEGSATTTVAKTLDPATLAPVASLIVDGGAASQAIPVRVMLTPTGNTQTLGTATGTFPTTLPLEPIVITSGTNSEPRIASTNDYGRALLAGTYQRELYPEPPFDAIYPPTSQSITFTPGNITPARNDLDLVAPTTQNPTPVGQLLDFDANQCSITGTPQDSRCAVVTRDDGLDGWRVWIEDAATKKRISVVHTFSNTLVNGKVTIVTQAAALLYTALRPTLGDGFNAVVAPPTGFLGVPRLETPLFGGTQGLKTLVVPTFPRAVAVAGVVAEPGDGGALLGYAARVTLVSASLTTMTGTSPLLHYETTVSTDDRGRFATVVPPGTYTATIEPAIGTGFAKATTNVAVDPNLTVTALTLQPPVRPVLRGRAILTDGRVLSEATVLAEPRTAADGTVGRPSRATTDTNGAYAIELDPGSYVFSVLPKGGTGFPRVVVSVDVGADPATLPDIRIPPPTPLSLTLRDPAVIGNPIVRAVVRIFASPPGNLPPVEIGNGMTDANGAVEILLAPQPQ